MSNPAIRAVVLTLGLAACGTAGAPDGGNPDSGAPDTGLAWPADLEWPELATGASLDPGDSRRIGADAVAADLSCLGGGMWPLPGAADPLELTARVFGGSEVVRDLCVRPYFDDHIVASDTCLPSDLRTDSAGKVTVSPLGQARFAFRMFARTGATDADTFGDTTLFHVYHGAGVTQLDATAVPQTVLNLIPVLVGYDPIAGTGIVGTAFKDCAGANVYGARFRLSHADGRYVVEGPSRSDPVVFYFDATENPAGRQPWTHVGGIAGFANIPVDDPGETFLLEVWGRPGGDTGPRVVACDELQLVPDGRSFMLAIRPLRADAPLCPGLR